jgi:hypothetical protein
MESNIKKLEIDADKSYNLSITKSKAFGTCIYFNDYRIYGAEPKDGGKRSEFNVSGDSLIKALKLRTTNRTT